ncbi:MAG: hypothetical protein JXA74_17560 [Anaerolineae bacterium]|nr:hypothetical protein [Anaerolineae bacterium]
MEERATQELATTAPGTRLQEYESLAVARRVGYVVTMIVNFVFLYVVHHLMAWGAPTITEEWALVVPALELSIGATIVAHALYLGYDARWFRRLTQIGLNVLGLRAMLTLYLIFPFAIEARRVAQWSRIGLLAIMAAIALGTLVEAIGLLSGRD